MVALCVGLHHHPFDAASIYPASLPPHAPA
jgi:hypothetical protein